MTSLPELVEMGVNAVIRPPRDEYDLSSLPTTFDSSNGRKYIRHPVCFTNQRKQRIVGSIYVDSAFDITSGLPCLIYMHGNASSQLEGQFLIPNVCPRGVALFLFDFAGCGDSGGDYISLGFYESQDVRFLLTMLEVTFAMKKFVFWGRSMGAATALLVNDKRVVGRIVDSAYTSIRGVCRAIAVSNGVPKILCPGALWILALSVETTAGFRIADVRPVDSARSKDNNIPLILGHARDDDFVPFRQGEKIFRVYNCEDKQFMELKGGHNGCRSTRWSKLCYRFVFEKLGVDSENINVRALVGIENNSAHFSSANSMLKNKRASNKRRDEIESFMNVEYEFSDGEE